jgi:hypothetical protein
LDAIEFSWREFTICDFSQHAGGTGNPHSPEYQALRARRPVGTRDVKGPVGTIHTVIATEKNEPKD